MHSEFMVGHAGRGELRQGRGRGPPRFRMVDNIDFNMYPLLSVCRDIIFKNETFEEM